MAAIGKVFETLTTLRRRLRLALSATSRSFSAKSKLGFEASASLEFIRLRMLVDRRQYQINALECGLWPFRNLFSEHWKLKIFLYATRKAELLNSNLNYYLRTRFQLDVALVSIVICYCFFTAFSCRYLSLFLRDTLSGHRKVKTMKLKSPMEASSLRKGKTQTFERWQRFHRELDSCIHPELSMSCIIEVRME